MNTERSFWQQMFTDSYVPTESQQQQNTTFSIVNTLTIEAHKQVAEESNSK